MSIVADWAYPTNIRFGAGRIAELPEVCSSLGVTRPLIVTDCGLAKLPMLRDAVSNCEQAGLVVAVFSDIKSNPVEENVSDGVAVLQGGQHDGVIAFGGGSALDVGKLIAFMAGQARPMRDFEAVDDWWSRANVDGILPVIALPTTAGTGSEVGRASVISFPDDQSGRRKKIIYHPRMMPAIVISDPQLTVGLPANLTAWTGMDALAHCFEAFCAPGFHPMADGIAVEGMRLIKQYLQRAVANGEDIEARAGMLAAATLGATAFQKGLGGIHALSHPVGALYDTHHGLTNAVFMPYVMAFNRISIEDSMRLLAGFLELPEATFDAVLDWVMDLRVAVNIPHTIREIGVDDERFDMLASMALKDPTAAGNPIVLTEAGCQRILENSFSGMLDI